MQGPSAVLLNNGTRLHLQHGPIDLIIGADGETDEARVKAFAAATTRFDGLLDGLAAELDLLRRQIRRGTPAPVDPVGKRMYHAAMVHCETSFVTPMIAVAGAVADAVLYAMLQAGPLRRAYVNNGGDIAVYLNKDAEFSVAMADPQGVDLGRIRFGGNANIGGVATSGSRGRSLSFGIADSVTVLASNAAAADAAATLIANAVDLKNVEGIQRLPASELQPDSDLGERLVTTFVPTLTPAQCATALKAGQSFANNLVAEGVILGAAMFLQKTSKIAGNAYCNSSLLMENQYA